MAPTLGLNISDDQRFALMKFRRNVSDCLKSHHDDHFLLRWLRARNWNPEAAEKMLREGYFFGKTRTFQLKGKQTQPEITVEIPFNKNNSYTNGNYEHLNLYNGEDVYGTKKVRVILRRGQIRDCNSGLNNFKNCTPALKSMAWREKWKVDEIENWEPSEVLVKYYPYGLSGFDKEGSPVIIVPFSGLDMVGMVHSVPRSDFVRITIKTLERMLKVAEKQSEKHGIEARKLVSILDMEGFSLKQYAWRPAGELVVALVKMYEANYPEILKHCFIVNAPRVFSVGFTIIKNFLNDYTISKIHVYKNEPKKWMPILLEKIDASQLPVHFGGTKVDENGDPKCSALICQGGKIPKSYYRDKNAEDPTDEVDQKKYVTSEVKKGGKLCLDFEVPTAGCILKWEFRTEQHDINFGVLRLETNGEETEEVPMRRVKCQNHEEIGVVTSNAQAKYRIVFDNTYSYLRSKKIHHLIQVFPPLVGNTDLVLAQ